MEQSQSTIPGSGIAFKRTGGRFVSYKTAVVLAILFLVILVLVFFLGRFSTGLSSKSVDDTPLPLRMIEPLHYDLVLKTELNNRTTLLEQFTFSGQVDIILRIKENTNYIELNSRKLIIPPRHTLLKRVSEKYDVYHFETMNEIELLHNISMWKNTSKNEVNIDEQELREATEKFVIHTAEPLEAGIVYLLSLQFEGIIEEDATGLYRTKYVGHGNELRWVIATQMEPNNARQVFPCFDEPDRKAMFTITLYHSEGYKAFSNMAISNSYKDDETGLEVLEFNTSPRLPPYLVSVILTNGFVSQSPANKHNIWTQPALINETVQAQVIIPRMIANFQILLNNSLPLDKIDFIGIPDYSTRGSESFGLVALEEHSLLYDTNNSSLEQYRSVLVNIGFHIVQQWFSNMVTPSSWKILWLREAFAKYLSYYGRNQLQLLGHDHLSDSFLVNEMQKSLYADSLNDAQPLFQMNLRHSRDIRLLNQELVYSKGGCLIRMLHHFIGDINFKYSLQEYIKKWYLKSISPSDVWDSFDESVNKLKMYNFRISVKQVMQSWVHNKGYPLVTVQIDRKNMVAIFTQKPFSMINDAGPQEWYIPVSFTTKEDSNFNSTKPKLLLTSHDPVTVNMSSNNPTSTWIIANIEQAGYFRVNYDTRSWDILLSQLTQDYYSIPHISRYQLVDDAFALAHSGHIRYAIPLQLSSLIGKYEKDLIPWQGLLKQIYFMSSILIDESAVQTYKQYIMKLLSTVYEELTKNKEANKHLQENEYLLQLITAVKCRYDYKGCLQWANKHFQDMLHSGEAHHKIVHGGFRGTIYSVVGRQRENVDWLYFWNKMKDPNVDLIEKYYLAEGLASTINETTINELFVEISKDDDSVIHKTLKVEILNQLGQHMQNLNIFLQSLSKHWESFYLKLQNHKDLLWKLVHSAGQQLSTMEHLISVRDLQMHHLSICAKEDKSLFDHIKEEINLKISLRDSHLIEIMAWMNKYQTMNN